MLALGNASRGSSAAKHLDALGNDPATKAMLDFLHAVGAISVHTSKIDCTNHSTDKFTKGECLRLASLRNILLVIETIPTLR